MYTPDLAVNLEYIAEARLIQMAAPPTGKIVPSELSSMGPMEGLLKPVNLYGT